jgi:hypothetical protein
MSGYAITKNYQAGMLFADYKLWREDAFCHQLSANGSLLLAHNHDPLWHALICQIIGWPDVAEWPRVRSVLRALPAWQARRALWRASYLWFAYHLRWHIEMLRLTGRFGVADEYYEAPATEALMRRLQLRAQQLDDLSWCAIQRTDSDDTSIAVVDALAPRRQRHALPAAQPRQASAMPVSPAAAERVD